MLGRWVQQVFVKSSDVQRHRQHIEADDSGVGADEALRDYTHEVRLRHDMQCLQVVRNRQHNVSSVTFFLKPGIDRILAEFPSNHSNMLHLKKVRHTRNLTLGRVAASHRAGIAISKQPLLRSPALLPRAWSGQRLRSPPMAA